MDGPLFHTNVRFGSQFIRCLVDQGCSCYATVSPATVRRLKLPTFSISPRPIGGVFQGQQRAITKVAYGPIDVGGHQQDRVFAYVIPDQSEDMILGQKWMEDQDVRLSPRKGCLTIKSTGIRIWNEHFVKSKADINQICSSVFVSLVHRARKQPDKGVEIFAASLRDIEKSLAVKKRTDPRTKLPEHYHEYLPLFDMKAADQLPPHRPGIDHKIELETDENGKEKEVPWGPLYNMSREELLLLRKTLTELLDKNFIRVSSSPAAAPVLFAKKPGGGLRFCVDYRGLNAVTRKDRYPLPLIRETLRSISRAKWLTKLDVSAAFHKIRITEGDEWKTAFRTRYGLYEYLVTPFGLTGAPATFQRYINYTLREYLDEFASAYLDDTLVYSDGSLDDHRRKVKLVLRKLQEAGLQLDVDKCEFECQTVKYLGFIVEVGKGIRMDLEKVAAIQSWEAPRTVKGVRSFLGFANYYRLFIPEFADIARPLTDLTKKGQTFHWNDKAQQAFDELKQRFISDPILATFDPDRETVLETDASNWATGGILSQYDDNGDLRPCAYFSKKNLPAECNYEIHDKELLAVIRCLEEWDAELRSVKSFTVLTDHKNLEYFMKIRRLNERQMRWAEILARYNYKLSYRPGKLASRPDALSRREQDVPEGQEDDRLLQRYRQLLEPSTTTHAMVTTRNQSYERDIRNDDERITTDHQPRADSDQFNGNDDERIATSIPHADRNQNNGNNDERTTTGTSRANGGQPNGNDDNTPNEWTIDMFERQTAPFTDPNLQALWDMAIEQDERFKDTWKAVASQLRKFPKELELHVSIAECDIDRNGRLRYRERIWIPDFEPLRTELVQQTHDSTLTGHPGRDATLAILSRRFYWPGVSQYVRKFSNNCDVCGRITTWRDKRWGLLKPLPIPNRIWREISMDFITGLPPARGSGATVCLVIVDRFSKGVIFESVTDMTAEGTADLFIKLFYRHHGLPAAITSDRGSQWVNAFWKRVCQLVGIERRLSTAYHPETDGSTEQKNQVLEAYLSAFVAYTQEDWAEHLPSAELAINNRNATSTGISSFFMTHGYNVEPIQVKEELDERNEHTRLSPIAAGEQVVKRLRDAREWAEAAIAAAQQTQEMHANRHRQPAIQFKVGDKVWLNLKNIKTDRPCKKIDWRHAKYTVTRVISSHAYELDVPPGIANRFHVVLLRPAATDPLPSQRRDDAQPPAIISDEGHPEWEVEEILRARSRKYGRGKQRQVHVKWKGYALPTWEPLRAMEDTVALDKFERRWGNAQQNDGPANTSEREGGNVTG